MQLTANEDILAATRDLVDCMGDDERDDYQEWLEQGERGDHAYLAIAEVDSWLKSQPQVLHMVTGSDVSCGIPEARCEILTAQQATERLQMILSEHCLPSFPYNPATDKVLAIYEPSDAMGHGYFGFTPIVAGTFTECITLTYERPDLPFDSWKVRVNGEVVYQEPEDEEDRDDEGTLVGDPENDEEGCTSSSYTTSSCSGTDGD